MMKTKLMTLALAATMTLGSVAPALADGAASTRNIILGAGAALLVTNIARKKKAKTAEQHQQSLRQTQYRDYYKGKYGAYPTETQYRDWYFRTYGVYPQ